MWLPADPGGYGPRFGEHSCSRVFPVQARHSIPSGQPHLSSSSARETFSKCKCSLWLSGASSSQWQVRLLL